MKSCVKSVLAVLAALCLSVSVFAGGGQDNSGAAGTGKPTLQLWHYYAEGSSTYIGLVEAIEAYNKRPDAKSTVVQQSIPRNDLLKRYALGVVSNELPDIGMVDNPDSASFAAMGMWADISDRVKTLKDNEFQSGPLASGMYKGKQYTLPARSNCIGLWLNDAMLKAAGVTTPPQTWDELLSASAKLRAKNPNVYPLALCALKTEEGTFQFLPFLQSAGGTAYEMNSAGGVKALSFLKELLDKKYISPEVINWTQNDVEKQFAAGNAAMMINGCWHIPNLAKDAPNMKYTVVKIPKDKEFSSTLGGENFGITKACKNMDAAWDFMAYFYSRDVNVKFNVANTTISPLMSATPTMQYPNDVAMQGFIDQLAYAAPRGPHPKWPEISLSIQQAIQEVLTGAKTAEKAAADADVKIQAILASTK